MTLPAQQHPVRRLSVAPMMDWTDRHDRYFLRLISRRALLYTEMVTTGAVLHGPRDRLLRFDPAEHPVACQIGGSEPDDLAATAEIVESYGYDEVNLNCGCPSDRVQQGRFGACLMAEPETVAAGVRAMIGATGLPVTVKSRIGIDEMDDYDGLKRFVEIVAEAGCRSFTVHARKAWLKGLSPKENRDIPPLRYELVYRLKQELPELEIVLNGGVMTLEEAEAHLSQVDGVMIGRAAYQEPYMLAGADGRLFGDPAPVPTRHELLRAFIPYVERELAEGTPLNHMTRHILGLFNGLPGARGFRRLLSENAHRPGAGASLILEAAEKVREGDSRVAA
ncbi:MAG: tRNA dihydrouridine(20/20a) synthase DusA [Alphaproteobacteria bacterium]|nr:tRNA dihydrouridine(20/20a) synthase DusA [Alphaproteobacteria bacterium]MBU0796218.1 tRNA dihydrouridine(20/20a) synthase DusA [Alphaproteobacteria bacterium]MBU0888434.1 tRNA dihydrouridine(20/20a) synthase DusA [Alphaproteobacteria bacterium]MBU1813103.1 tRNA dihydrouridine(20/20a) synthase DusA [Alphaproteobacteria bacterium]